MNVKISRKMEVLFHLWMKNFDDLKTYLFKSLHILGITNDTTFSFSIFLSIEKLFSLSFCIEK